MRVPPEARVATTCSCLGSAFPAPFTGTCVQPLLGSMRCSSLLAALVTEDHSCGWYQHSSLTIDKLTSQKPRKDMQERRAAPDCEALRQYLWVRESILPCRGSQGSTGDTAPVWYEVHRSPCGHTALHHSAVPGRSHSRAVEAVLPSQRDGGFWVRDAGQGIPRPRGLRVVAAQTQVSPRLLKDRGRGRVLGSHPSPDSCPRPAPEARSSGARRSVARPIDTLGAPTAEVRVQAAGRRGAGPCPCRPAGRCAGQGLGEAAGGAGGGREGRQLPSGPCHCSPDCWGAAAGVLEPQPRLPGNREGPGAPAQLSGQLRASRSPSPADPGTERVLEPRPSFLGSCGGPGVRPLLSASAPGAG
ncbi:unnamed protein product [Rangifer tarandus platyrhynchus]|uniref:Uncharacterized protein n=1 Tax=Rangifer tarandus platyrhynchus TaxID=3082113 RepID=A0ABN8ZA62_RANTA|nr:unnamed protein product [Rangifer tarandus platyrhynchus]